MSMHVHPGLNYAQREEPYNPCPKCGTKHRAPGASGLRCNANTAGRTSGGGSNYCPGIIPTTVTIPANDTIDFIQNGGHN